MGGWILEGGSGGEGFVGEGAISKGLGGRLEELQHLGWFCDFPLFSKKREYTHSTFLRERNLIGGSIQGNKTVSPLNKWGIYRK